MGMNLEARKWGIEWGRGLRHSHDINTSGYLYS